MLTIIDYNAGNIASIQNMLKKIGIKCKISSIYADIEQADKLILPGVGSFDYGISNLKQDNLIEIIKKKALVDKIPILGICLGAQLMGNMSEEGKLSGLGLINMDVRKFDTSKFATSLKVPHMGWDEVLVKKNHPVFEDMYPDPRFYFVHSYHFVPHNIEDILTTTEYGYEFVSAFQHENIIGVQFHPEKSHKFGMKLLENFVKM
jgi:imidazole glycerol-phosphate synthase subunit HisH